MTGFRKVALLYAIMMATPAAALLAAPAQATAQSPAQAQTPVQTQTQEDAAIAALRSSMSASAHASFAATVRDARERGLPVQPLIAKAQEGAAKNVADDRILLAVAQTTERLGRAQELLSAAGARMQGAGAAAEISAVADAIQRGVPDHALARLADDANGQPSVGLSAHALADLTEHGVPLAVGLEVIGAWRGQGADPARLNEIPAAIERLVRQGVVPARAGAAVAAGLRIGRRPGSITPNDVRRIPRG